MSFFPEKNSEPEGREIFIRFFDTKNLDLGYYPDMKGLVPSHEERKLKIWHQGNEIYLLLDGIFYVMIERSERRVSFAGNMNENWDQSYFHQFIMTPIFEISLRIFGYFTAHAGANAEGGDAVLVFGNSGSGKSSNAVRLALRGRPLLGDDTAVIDSDLFAHPFLKPLHLKKDALLELFPGEVPGTEGEKAALPVDRVLSRDMYCSEKKRIKALYFLDGFGKSSTVTDIPAREVFKRILSYSLIPVSPPAVRSQMDIIEKLSGLPAFSAVLKKGEYLDALI